MNLLKFIADSWDYTFTANQGIPAVFGAIGTCILIFMLSFCFLTWNLTAVALRIIILSGVFAVLPYVSYYLHLKGNK